MEYRKSVVKSEYNIYVLGFGTLKVNFTILSYRILKYFAEVFSGYLILNCPLFLQNIYFILLIQLESNGRTVGK